MKRPILLKAGLALCVLVMLNACQKEISTSSINDAQSIRASGAVKDDPALLLRVPVIISSDFVNETSTVSPGSNSRKRPPGSGTDVTPPSVSITSPSNGATVTGTITVTTNASDNVGVRSVSLSLDGISIGSSTTAPYNFSWNTSSISDGTHTLKAQATDAAGNTASSSITVAKNTTVVVLPPSSPSSSFLLQMPPVGYQGSEYSCVAFAVGYAARSAEEFYKSGASSYSYATNIFSPEFLYDQTKISADCGSGTSLMIALDYLTSTGICKWQTMPYSSADGCSITPNSTQFSDAANYKIPSYSALYKSDINGIKSMLSNHHPVIFTASLDNSFMNAQPGFIWNTYSGNPGISHAMVICGYDDNKHAWKVMNSWGTGWADAGYGWIDYDFLPQTGSAWTFVIN